MLTTTLQRTLAILSLIVAGEVIFALPFHTSRFFRPTFLEEFGLTNTELGDMFALYGIVAMLAYFPGGFLADRFAPRWLIVVSLVLTGAGGLILAFVPSKTTLYVLFGYWGFTTIFLFWAAMIKATRIWGGANSQGLAFGLLDGGRGLVASVLATGAIWLLPWLAQGQAELSMQLIIYYYTAATFLAAVLVWWTLGDGNVGSVQAVPGSRQAWSGVARNPSVWWLAGIVVAAYCGYKGIDNYGLYAAQVLGMSDLASAKFVTAASYTRPIAALCAGLLADRIGANRLIRYVFGLLVLSYLVQAVFGFVYLGATLIMANLVLSVVAVYALRGVYFAVLQESRIAAHHTGAAVGIVSLVGYTPDIFFAPLTGRILDAGTPAEGFANYFLVLTILSVLGLLCAMVLARKVRREAP
ncbi:hypothetical protein A3709_15990 [Halioglobus sp. HI00S01]|nr:hypothetical protein A3709_15990 [Halioglobus sp. HI00S01]